MAFVLAMLKIIGIIVAVILAVAVAVAAVVFVMPFKYELAAEKYEKIKADGKIKWLFGAVDVSFLYDEEAEVSLKLFGHKLYPKEEKKAKVKKRGAADTESGEKPKEVQTKEEAPKAGDEPKTVEKKPTEVKKAVEKKAIKSKSEPMAKKDVTPKVVRVKMVEETQTEDEAEKEPQKMTKKDFVLGYIKDMPFEEKKTAVLEMLSLLKGVIKHICPQKIRLYAVVGLEDPATVGYILAAGGIARGFTGQDITIVGDFEKQRFDGEGDIEGKIRLGTLLIICLRLVFSRPVRRFIMRFLKVRGELI